MYLINGKSVLEIVGVYERAVQVFIGLPDNPKPESKGGILSIWNQKTKAPQLVLPIGGIIPEKVRIHWWFSEEKGLRLLGHPQHLSSWQSRNYKELMYGGAIATGDLILSFSGLREYGDEAVNLCGSRAFNWIDLFHARRIVEISQNPFFESMGKRFHRDLVA